MNWLSVIEVKDWIAVLATLLSPLIAIQVTKHIERQQQSKDEQLRIFKTLMATRASALDSRHVESLNMIDVVFCGGSKRELEIRRLWKQYLDHLNDRNCPIEYWEVKRLEIMADLLHSMAIFLGFDFDKTHIKNQTYYPVRFGEQDSDQVVIRKALREILTGQRAVPMWVTNFSTGEQHNSETEKAES